MDANIYNSLSLSVSRSIKGIKKEERHFEEKKREKKKGGFSSAFLPLFGFAFICSNRARKWIAGRWNEKQKRMNRRISENNTLCPRSTDYYHHSSPHSFPNRPGTSYINIWLPTVFEGMMQREPLTEAKDTGCFLPNIAFVRFISSPPSLLPYPSSIPSSSTNRKIFLLGGKLRLSPDVEEMNFFLTNIYAWGRREKLPVLEMLDVLSDNKRSVVGRSSTGWCLQKVLTEEETRGTEN